MLATLDHVPLWDRDAYSPFIEEDLLLVFNPKKEPTAIESIQIVCGNDDVIIQFLCKALKFLMRDCLGDEISFRKTPSSSLLEQTSDVIFPSFCDLPWQPKRQPVVGKKVALCSQVPKPTEIFYRVLF